MSPIGNEPCVHPDSEHTQSDAHGTRCARCELSGEQAKQVEKWVDERTPNLPTTKILPTKIH